MSRTYSIAVLLLVLEKLVGGLLLAAVFIFGSYHVELGIAGSVVPTSAYDTVLAITSLVYGLPAIFIGMQPGDIRKSLAATAEVVSVIALGALVLYLTIKSREVVSSALVAFLVFQLVLVPNYMKLLDAMCSRLEKRPLPEDPAPAAIPDAVLRTTMNLRTARYQLARGRSFLIGPKQPRNRTELNSLLRTFKEWDSGNRLVVEDIVSEGPKYRYSSHYGKAEEQASIREAMIRYRLLLLARIREMSDVVAVAEMAARDAAEGNK